MRYEWMDAYLLAKPAVTKDLQAEWNWIRYKIGDRMFAAILLDDEDKPVYINLKLEPTEGEFLREQFEDIIPGYYSDKRCWNSVKPNGKVPDELLKSLLDKSYELVLKGFAKKKQRELLGISCCGTKCVNCDLPVVSASVIWQHAQTVQKYLAVYGEPHVTRHCLMKLLKSQFRRGYVI